MAKHITNKIINWFSRKKNSVNEKKKSWTNQIILNKGKWTSSKTDLVSNKNYKINMQENGKLKKHGRMKCSETISI